MVRAEGFEPPRLASLEPKSSASTNSATPAAARRFAALYNIVRARFQRHKRAVSTRYSAYSAAIACRHPAEDCILGKSACFDFAGWARGRLLKEILNAIEAFGKWLGGDPTAIVIFLVPAFGLIYWRFKYYQDVLKTPLGLAGVRERLAAHGGWRKAYFGHLRRALAWVDKGLGPLAWSAEQLRVHPEIGVYLSRCEPIHCLDCGGTKQFRYFRPFAGKFFSFASGARSRDHVPSRILWLPV